MKSLRCLILSIVLTLSIISVATSYSTTGNNVMELEEDMRDTDMMIPSQHRRYLRGVENIPTGAAAAAEEQDYYGNDEEDMMQNLDMVVPKVDGNHRELYNHRYRPGWRYRHRRWYPIYRRRRWHRRHWRDPFYWNW